MLESHTLAWQFYLSIPQERWLEVLPWHLMLVLGILGALSILGANHLLGYWFRYFRRPQGNTSLGLAGLSLVIMTLNMMVLLVSYLAWANKDRLVQLTLQDTPEYASELGQVLLAPMLPALEGDTPNATGLTRTQILGALSGWEDRPLREQMALGLGTKWPSLSPLASEIAEELAKEDTGFFSNPFAAAPEPDAPAAPQTTPPSLPSVVEGPQPPQDLTALFALLALRWVEQPEWPENLPQPTFGLGPSDSDEADAEELLVADVILALLEEIPADIPLSQDNWTHLLGTQMAEMSLLPRIHHSFNLAILTGLVLLALVNMLYFWQAGNIRRRWRL